jgi:hypothetical protein
MKTSNKILSGLIIVIFVVPFLLAATLKSKMKKGIYTVEKNYAPDKGGTRSGTFTAFKVVKVIAPRPELLTCNLKQSDKMSFDYFNDGSNDSLAVFTSNDTLYVQYIAQQEKSGQHESRGYGKIVVNINLPFINHLIVDGAEVILDSPSAASGLSVSLKNNGEIKQGNDSEKDAPPVSSIKKERVLQELKTDKEEVVSVDENKNMGVVQNIGLKLIDFDVEDFLVYHLLNKL